MARVGVEPLSIREGLTARGADATMAVVDFVTALTNTLHQRQAVNARYSLRAFARSIGVSHSASSRLLNRRQHPTDATIRRVGARLGWSLDRVTALIRAEHWHRLAVAAGSPHFTPDGRSLASRANLSLDDVQIALHEALRTNKLEMKTDKQWRVTR